MARKERWSSQCKTIECRYLAGITWTQSEMNPADEKDLASEQMKEPVTAQPRENYENVDCLDHDDISTRDDGCLHHEFLPNNPTRIANRVAKELEILAPRNGTAARGAQSTGYIHSGAVPEDSGDY
eukprot:2389491-Pyramimonas_sp.AAC.1